MPRTSDRLDPLTVFSFGLEIDTSSGGTAPSFEAPSDNPWTMTLRPQQAFFKSVNGLKVEIESTDLLEGGENGYTRKLLGRLKWGNIVLKNGFTGDTSFFNHLYYSIMIEGGGVQRFDGVIYHYGPARSAKCSWKFKRGAVVKWEGSELDASKNELAIETIEIQHEGLELWPGDMAGSGIS